VENQVRELDVRLLLACIAAKQGFSSIIGLHREIDFRIASFPRGIYLCKSMTERNLKMFQIMRNVGHQIVTWDEEALVHLPPETYYSRRLDPKGPKNACDIDFAGGGLDINNDNCIGNPERKNFQAPLTRNPWVRTQLRF
jgi:surface carbohydrate biosynthesis protein